MPGDARLVPAIRDLTTQAGTYANLPADQTTSLAERVVDATASLISATGAADAPIEFNFFRSRDTLRVTLTWRENGSEQRREVEQKTSA